ncbi:MAG: AAA family ATPase [Acidiferrobacterales bacterium]
MALRAKKPEAIKKRLKFFLFGVAGVGKTMAAIQFRNNYLVDAERGQENDEYIKAIAKADSQVFQCTELDEVIVEVRELLTTPHDFRTITIDPITTLYNEQLEKSARKVGTDFGRHYNDAAIAMNRLVRLLMRLDMNVIVTSHAKAEYGDDMKKIGITFDAWKKLDYMFDLVLHLERRGRARVATVRKTRLAAFPDGETFDWSYAEFLKRHGQIIEEKTTTATLATAEQVAEVKRLVGVVVLPDGTTDKWLKKADADCWEDMTTEQIVKCIEHLTKRMDKPA